MEQKRTSIDKFNNPELLKASTLVFLLIRVYFSRNFQGGVRV